MTLKRHFYIQNLELNNTVFLQFAEQTQSV